MKVLLVAATDLELNPILEKIGETNRYSTLVTGVGMTATAFSMGKELAVNKYDLAINIGLAGAFDRSLELGEVVSIVEDQLSEEGAESGEAFLSLAEIGLEGVGVIASTYSVNLPDIPSVKGITVNMVHGAESSIESVSKRLNPQVETMEGAAFFYACKMSGTPCIQVRAISNYVEKRKREAWKVDLALNNLAERVSSLLKQLYAEA